MSNASPATRNGITDQHLQELHRAYQDFMQTCPWMELNDRNILLFNDSDPDLQACCTVMGHWGAEYGLAAYIGESAINTLTGHALGGDRRLPQQVRTVAATTGRKSLVGNSELRRMHHLGIEYPNNNRYPVWFSCKPDWVAKDINDREASALAVWLRVATDAALRIRSGVLKTTTMGLMATDNCTFYPIECVKSPDGFWQYTATTLVL